MASEYLPHVATYAGQNLLQYHTISISKLKAKKDGRKAPAIRGPRELAHNHPGFAATARQLHTSTPCPCLLCESLRDVYCILLQYPVQYQSLSHFSSSVH